jgi:hypothetical protein
MVQSTIEKIEESVQLNSLLTENNKTEILNLLAALKPEITELEKERAEHAESIAGFIERSTHELMRKEKNPTLLKYAVDGMAASVEGFEVTHPKLVENVNYFANVLANMGL